MFKLPNLIKSMPVILVKMKRGMISTNWVAKSVKDKMPALRKKRNLLILFLLFSAELGKSMIFNIKPMTKVCKPVFKVKNHRGAIIKVCIGSKPVNTTQSNKPERIVPNPNAYMKLSPVSCH